MPQKTIKELISEMSHRTVSPEEIEQAREYEKSLIPDDLIIPLEGEVFVFTKPAKCTSMVQFSAPFTGGSDCEIPKGTRVKVLEYFDEKPLVISCVPINEDECKSIFVEISDLKNKLYAGYYLSVNTAMFVECTENSN